MRRKITETEIHTRSLMHLTLNEHEDIHRLHHHLLDLRRQHEQDQGLTRTFNLKADPRKRTRPQDGGRTPRKKRKFHPRGT